MFERPPAEREWVSWLWALLGALAIYITIPFARAISRFVTEHWGRQTFLHAMLVVTALGLLAALGMLWRRRARMRRANVLWVLFVGSVYVYFILSLKSAPEEALHFAEYGALGILIFRALSHRVRDPGLYVAAFLVGSIAGTLDEVIQWLTPDRVFEFRDIGLNAFAGALMQFAIWKGFEPPFIAPPLQPGTFRRICALGALQTAILGACLMNTPRWTERLIRVFPCIEHVRHKSSAMSEYGHRHVLPGMGIFYSRFTPEEWRRLDRARAEEAAEILDAYHDPTRYGAFLSMYTPLTDPFLHELRVHLFRRDHYRAVTCKHRANPKMFAWHNTVAYRENQFVETFFPHTLARSKYRMIPGHVATLRRDMDERIVYESAVSRNLITGWTERQARGFVLAALIGLGIAAVYSYRWERRKPSDANET